MSLPILCAIIVRNVIRSISSDPAASCLCFSLQSEAFCQKNGLGITINQIAELGSIIRVRCVRDCELTPRPPRAVRTQCLRSARQSGP